MEGVYCVRVKHPLPTDRQGGQKKRVGEIPAALYESLQRTFVSLTIYHVIVSCTENCATPQSSTSAVTSLWELREWSTVSRPPQRHLADRYVTV